MAFDPKELRNAFGAFPTGVTVVTTVAPGDIPVGFTANSFTSVSLDPPMLLVCPGRRLSSFDVFKACDRFAVNVLAEGQESVSNIFAGFAGDRFAEIDWHADDNGLPLVSRAAAQFSCRTAEVVPAGDHIVLIGTVTGFTHLESRGLGYVAGRYFSLGLEKAAAEAPIKGRPTFAGAVVLAEDAILLEQSAQGYRVPSLRLDPKASARSSLDTWFGESGMGVSLGRTYSIYDGANGEHFTFFLATAPEAANGRLGQFVPLADLASLSFADPAEKAMVKRFATETENQVYGFYVGDSHTGYVHSMPQES